MQEIQANPATLLAFDCSGSTCSAAVLTGETVLAERFAIMQRGQAETIMPLIREVMAEARIDFAGLDALATTIGPGSFTGLRIGLAAARGLALVTGKPILVPTAFESYAAQVAEVEAEHIVIAIDSRRDAVFVQLFAPGGRALGEPESVEAQSAGYWLPAGRTLIVGDGTAPFAALGRTDLELRPSQLRASDVARAAFTVPARPSRPLYLRAPDVTLKQPAPS